jgi:hypothetical protein
MSSCRYQDDRLGFGELSHPGIERWFARKKFFETSGQVAESSLQRLKEDVFVVWMDFRSRSSGGREREYLTLAGVEYYSRTYYAFACEDRP